MSVASSSLLDTKQPFLGAPGVGSLAVLALGTLLLGHFYGPAQGALFLASAAALRHRALSRRFRLHVGVARLHHGRARARASRADDPACHRRDSSSFRSWEAARFSATR